MVFDKPRSLSPLFLLPRTHLPLACLDTENLSGPLPRSRFFAAHMESLEASSLRNARYSGPVVLIARLDADRSLYAIERVKRGRYALCKLGKWVDLEELRGAAILARSDATAGPKDESNPNDRSAQFGSAGQEKSALKASAAIKRRRLDDGSEKEVSIADLGNQRAELKTRKIIPGAVTKTAANDREATPSGPESQAVRDIDPSPLQQGLPIQMTQTQQGLVTEPMTQPPNIPAIEFDPRDIFRMVQTQYLEALYMSKVRMHRDSGLSSLY